VDPWIAFVLGLLLGFICLVGWFVWTAKAGYWSRGRREAGEPAVSAPLRPPPCGSVLSGWPVTRTSAAIYKVLIAPVPGSSRLARTP
jgi:hypothetical protein